MSLKKNHAKNMNVEKKAKFGETLSFRCKNATSVVSLSEAARKISINKGAFHLK